MNKTDAKCKSFSRGPSSGAPSALIGLWGGGTYPRSGPYAHYAPVAGILRTSTYNAVQYTNEYTSTLCNVVLSVRVYSIPNAGKVTGGLMRSISLNEFGLLTSWCWCASSGGRFPDSETRLYVLYGSVRICVCRVRQKN